MKGLQILLTFSFCTRSALWEASSTGLIGVSKWMLLKENNHTPSTTWIQLVFTYKVSLSNCGCSDALWVPSVLNTFHLLRTGQCVETNMCLGWAVFLWEATVIWSNTLEKCLLCAFPPSWITWVLVRSDFKRDYNQCKYNLHKNPSGLLTTWVILCCWTYFYSICGHYG